MYDLLVIGAGPAGLATAIAAKQAGFDYVVVDRGGLVDGIVRFPLQMVFFTTPELLEIGGLPFVTPYDKPTRHEALRYYRRVADTFDIALALDEPVTTIVRHAERDQFRVYTQPRHGEAQIRAARSVVVATGYFDHPNRLEIPGEDLPHVSHYYTEAHPYYRKRVVVVGGKNSAAEAALDLHRAGARVTVVHRARGLGSSIKYWVKPDIENRIAEGAIPARFESVVRAITPSHVALHGPDGDSRLPADAVFLLTGYHPDFTFLRAAGVNVDDEQQMAIYDPHTQETNVPNLFLAGGVVSGRNAPPVFIENGRFHGARIVQTLQTRWGVRAHRLTK